MLDRLQKLLLSLACVVALAIGYATDNADAGTAYFTPVAIPASIPCSSDQSCGTLANITIKAVTYNGQSYSVNYYWDGITACSDNGSSVLKPTGATHCFHALSPNPFGVSVTNPGTGSLEALLPVKTNTYGGFPGSACTTSCVFTATDLQYEVRRSNSGTIMTDTFPASSAIGLSNGARITINDVDASAADILTAGSGTTFSANGSSSASYTVPAGRSVAFTYDAANTIWRPIYNTGSPLLAVGLGSISAMQSIGPAAGVSVATAIVYGAQGDGSPFVWTAGSPACGAGGNIDYGTQWCALDASGGYRSDGYWQRQNMGPFRKDVWYRIKRDGLTDNTALFPKWLASCSGNIMLDTVGTALYSSVGATIYTPPANCQWQTVPGSNDNFTVNTSSNVLLNQTNPNFSIIGTGTVTLNVPSGGFSNLLYPNAAGLLLKDFTFDGGMADNGSTVTTGSSRMLYVVSNTDSSNITLDNVKAKNIQSVYTKYGTGTTGGTCDTSNQNKIVVNKLIATNVYAFGLNFNSPCGSQTNIKVTNSSITSAAQAPLIAASSGGAIGIGFASGKDILVDGNTVTGAFLDAFHFEQDVQNFRITNNHVEIPSGVSGAVNRGIDVIPADIQTSLVFKHPVHGVIAGNTINLTGSTTGATAMGIGVWRSTATPPEAFAEDLQIYGNTVTGAWPTGFYDEASNLSNTVSFHDNIADGATTGMFVYRGGSGIYNNTSKNCTTGLLYTVASVQSHNFNNCTQTLAGTFSNALLWIGTLRWDFAPVSLAAAASQTYELLDFDASNARLTGLPSVSTNSTDGTARVFNYVGGANNNIWDGTNYGTGSALSTLTALAVGGSGATSSFAHGTTNPPCVWGSAASCWTFSLTNSAGTTQSISASVTVSGGAYIRKGM